MTVLHLSGIVTGAPCYNVEPDEEEPVSIGGVDVLSEVDEIAWTGPVTIAFADKSWTGDIYAEHGWGYSEFTPMDADELRAGPAAKYPDTNNVLQILSEHYQDQYVDLWIADEPFNTLEDR